MAPEWLKVGNELQAFLNCLETKKICFLETKFIKIYSKYLIIETSVTLPGRGPFSDALFSDLVPDFWQNKEFFGGEETCLEIQDQNA